MRLAIIDIETTGLDPRKNCILEVHCRTVESDSLLQVGCFHALVAPVSLEHMDEYVRKMHIDNGLLERLQPPPSLPGTPMSTWVRGSGGRAYAADAPPPHGLVEHLLAVHLRQLQVADDRKSVMLTGNSLGALDRPMLAAWMPTALDKVHYRMLDVSAVRSYYREVLLSQLPPRIEELVQGGGPATHRAADDTLTCLQTLRQMRAWADKGLKPAWAADWRDAEDAGWERDWTHATDDRGTL